MVAVTPDISVVVPIYNEKDTLEELYTRLTATLEKLGRPYEIVAVDDGSIDGSTAIMQEFHRKDHRFRVLCLSRNFGQSPALYAGFSNAKGRYVVMIDGDLQVFPEDIPLLVSKLDEGFDVVTGWRADRLDSLFRRVFSRGFNWYIGKVTGLPIHDYGCALKGVKRELVDHMSRLEHRCRYLPADLALLGGRVAEVKVRHSERLRGTSKYGFFKLVRTAFDMITSITDAPLRYIGLLGWLISVAGFGMSVKVAIYRIVHGNILQLESVIAIFFLCTGVQLVAVGAMCEYLGRIFVEVQKRPYYIVREDEPAEPLSPPGAEG